MDVNQNIHERPSAFTGTPIQDFLSIHQFLYGRNHDFYGSPSAFGFLPGHLLGYPSEFILPTITSFVDLRQLSYGRQSEPLLASVRTLTDVHQNIHGPPAAFMRMSIRTFCGRPSANHHFRQLSYGRQSESLLASVRTPTDVHQNIHGPPAAFMRMAIRTSCGRPSQHSRAVISLHVAINQDHCGRPSEHS